MQSKWSHLKAKAIGLRRKGNSLTQISADLGIPKPTLSGWFSGLVLNKKAQATIRANWVERLKRSRENAASWHNKQKLMRIEIASRQAFQTFRSLDGSIFTTELALALLYLGEGGKGYSGTAMGNSDPTVLKFFISVLVYIYAVPIKNIKADLHLRADQNPVILRRYWSKSLGLPIKNFRSTIFDKRTIGKPTYPGYNGVCLITCGNIQIQRKLVFLARLYCESFIKNCKGG